MRLVMVSLGGVMLVVLISLDAVLPLVMVSLGCLSHMDHCGALPYFTEALGYRGPIYMTVSPFNFCHCPCARP